MLISITFICHLFLCPIQASYGCIWCVFIPSVVWRFSNKFPVPLVIGKFALNRQNFLHICVRCSLRILSYWAGIWRMGMSVCMSIYSDTSISVHLYVLQYIHTSVVTFYIHLYIYTSILSHILHTSMSDCSETHLTGFLGIPLFWNNYRLVISL